MEIDFCYLGLVFILVHELDAMRCKEWRILPLLSRLPETKAQTIFIVLHLPLLYMLLVESLKVPNEALQEGLNYFYIIHLGLHLLLLKHPQNAFKDGLSWFLIVGTAFCGALDLYF